MLLTLCSPQKQIGNDACDTNERGPGVVRLSNGRYYSIDCLERAGAYP